MVNYSVSELVIIHPSQAPIYYLQLPLTELANYITSPSVRFGRIA